MNKGMPWTAEEILEFRERAKQFSDDYDAGSFADDVIRWLATIDSFIQAIHEEAMGLHYCGTRYYEKTLMLLSKYEKTETERVKAMVTMAGKQ